MEAGAHSTRQGGSHQSNFEIYDWQIFSSAKRLRMTSVAPFICINCFFLNSENRRLTVSRVVPIISATSSCVIVSFTCADPSSWAVLVVHESSSLANFSDGETASPNVRISSYAVK